jgi:hypothetical protein
MADWTFVPSASGHSMTFREALPPVRDQFGDGTESIRERSSVVLREWDETYVLNATDSDAAVAFYKTKRRYVSFTRITYDPDEAVGAEATVRFDGFQKIGALPGGYNEFRGTMREIKT